MPRPCKPRRIRHCPDAVHFKPQGIPLRQLEEVALAHDEIEALRLADLEGLSHEDVGQRMEVSRATAGRILASGRRKVALALVEGMAIRIETVSHTDVATDDQTRSNDMPGMDRKGPMGEGPKTGRGLGRCNTETSNEVNESNPATGPGRGPGRGAGRGAGRGLGRGAERGTGLGRGGPGRGRGGRGGRGGR